MSSAREMLTKLLSNVIGRRDGGNGPKGPPSSNDDRSLGKILNVHLNEQCMFAQNQSGGSSSNINIHLQTENNYHNHNPLFMDNMNVNVDSLHPGLADLLNKFGANVPRHNGTNPNFRVSPVSAPPACDLDDSDRGDDDDDYDSDGGDQGGDAPHGHGHRHTSTVALYDDNKGSEVQKPRSRKRAKTANQMVDAVESNAPMHKVAKIEKPNETVKIVEGILQTVTRPPLRRSSIISPMTFAHMERMEKLDKTKIQVDTAVDKDKIIEHKDFMSTTALAASGSSSSAQFLGSP